MSQIKKIVVHESKPVSSNAILTFQVPPYKTIDDICIRATNSGSPATKANIISAIGKVALAINGEQVINCNISQLFDVFEFLGNNVQETTLVNNISLNLGRLMQKLNVNKDYFAWGCADVKTIQLQIYCAATTTGVTDIQVITERRDFDSKLGSYIKIINYPQSMASTGYSVVSSLPQDTNDGYLALLCNAGGGVISTGECSVNGDNIIDEVGTDVMAYICQERGFKNVSGYFSYLYSDTSARGVLPMNGVTDFRIKTNFTTAPTSGVYDLLAISVKNMPAEMVAAVNA